jgi:hypothetical protein
MNKLLISAIILVIGIATIVLGLITNNPITWSIGMMIVLSDILITLNKRLKI